VWFVRCSVPCILQCVATRCSLLQCVAVCPGWSAVCLVCCSVLQFVLYVAVRCSVLQYISSGQVRVYVPDQSVVYVHT